MGYWTSLNLNIIILMVSPYQNSKLKIQMLAGNSLNVCPDSDSQKKLPLSETVQSETAQSESYL